MQKIAEAARSRVTEASDRAEYSTARSQVADQRYGELRQASVEALAQLHRDYGAKIEAAAKQHQANEARWQSDIVEFRSANVQLVADNDTLRDENLALRRRLGLPDTGPLDLTRVPAGRSSRGRER